ncbi:transcription factor IIIB 90 kDa subunit isoform X2 [Agrilus planipennis]|uniref:B-related factor 1 n=1 Tax=Agrilus planipennis TaxID=224129 RepID=A0A7F5RAZ3_AGRPL|nr:transcription factor IIIB 90 kDa subunit isoform X2 [Agrilus planipennis]
MSSARRCKNCGSSDIEVDPARGDAVCTNCGSVLEDSIIVSEVQFEENAHGTSSAIGQFVSAESKGGASSFGACKFLSTSTTSKQQHVTLKCLILAFHVGMGVESRELTLKYARVGISNLCNQLRLNQHCVDTACNFYKMALTRNLTRGRRHAHVYAACVYLTCRTEGTPHLLIDISDVLQICCYELGRTYLRLSQALCINVPSVDPCLYILRFAAKLEFGSKTQEVANTALRLVQRMKRDSIHSGRRPSGLCGAALLMAARLHEFNRTPSDIVKIVKVHGSTLRKRLVEFGETPSSSLTLEEFMTVDLEEEQDPPSFKAARKKDKERLQKLMEEEGDNLTELQKQIENHLENKTKRARKPTKAKEKESPNDINDVNRFVEEEIIGTISQIIKEGNVDDPSTEEHVLELGPNISSMGLAKSLDDTRTIPANTQTEIEIDLDDVDDEELDAYIMNEDEVQHKDGLWHKLNASYLEEQKIKQEKLAKEKEEGKPEKKRRRTTRRRNNQTGPSSSATEAIEKILQGKKVSSKINYDVLKTLNALKPEGDGEKEVPVELPKSPQGEPTSSSEITVPENVGKKSKHLVNIERRSTKKKEKSIGLPVYVSEPTKEEEKATESKNEDDKMENAMEEDIAEDFEEEPVTQEPEMGMLDMLRQHQQGHGDDEEPSFGYDYEEDEY